MRKLLLIPLFVLLAGCQTAGAPPATDVPAPASDPLTNIANFTVTDLQNADADAVAHSDAIAHACYPALIQFVQSVQGAGAGTTVSGAFGAFQRARDVRNGVASGIPDYLILGCGPLYAQVHGDLLKVLAGIGVSGVVPLPVLKPSLLP